MYVDAIHKTTITKKIKGGNDLKEECKFSTFYTETLKN